MALSVKNLTDAMEQAFQYEWQQKKTQPFPATGEPDRRMMFAAIARGILTYLQSSDAKAMFSDITLSDGSISNQQFTVNNVDLSITLDE